MSGWIYLAIVGLLLPWLAIRNARKVRELSASPSRTAFLTSFAVSQATILALALLTAWREWVPLFPAPHLVPAGLLAAAGFLVVSLGTLPLRWSWRTLDEKRRRLWMLPRRASDLVWWTGVALTAGIVEEIAYRGVLFTLLLRLLGSWWPAVLVCVTLFALVHAVQGARTVVIIAALSIGIHAIVRLTGDLYTAMALHFAYDLLAGVVLLRLARKDGLLDEEPRKPL